MARLDRYSVRITGPHSIAVSWSGYQTEPEYRDNNIAAKTLATKIRREIAKHLIKPGATMGNYQW